MWKVQRTIFPHDATVHAPASHSSFLTWINVIFRDGRRLAHLLAGSGRTTPATWSTLRRGAYSVPRDHPTPAPDSSARRQTAEAKMVGYMAIAHGIAQRLSEKWRHCACTFTSPHVCTSPFCVGMTVVQELHLRCMALTQQRWVSMPEQANAAHAAGSKEAHTDIRQAPDASHTGYLGQADGRGSSRRGAVGSGPNNTDWKDPISSSNNTDVDIRPGWNRTVPITNYKPSRFVMI